LNRLGVATTTEIARHIGVKALEVGPVLKALQSCGRVSQGKRATKIDGRNRQVSTWALKQEAAE
jgi:transcription initiation factor IIE alpha subunit